MPRRGFKGGAIGDYRIKDVLGESFQVFVRELENGPQNFTIEAYSKAGIDNFSPPGSSPNDIHPNFIAQIEGIAAAFREIEKPDVTKAEAAGIYSSKLENNIRDLLTGNYTGDNTPETAKFMSADPETHFPHFPNLPYLVPGHNMLRYNETTYPGGTKDREQNSLILIIRYLYNFIALLDTKSVSGLDVVSAAQQDYLNFAPHFTNFIEDIRASNLYQGENVLKFNNPGDANVTRAITVGVIKGLAAIADKIISDYNDVSNQGQVSSKVTDIKTLDFTKIALTTTVPPAVAPGSVQEYFVKIGMEDALARKLTTALDAIDLFSAISPQTADANYESPNVNGTAEEKKADVQKFAIESARNFIYVVKGGGATLNGTDIKTVLTNDEWEALTSGLAPVTTGPGTVAAGPSKGLKKKPTKGGAMYGGSMYGGVGNFPSLPFLYDQNTDPADLGWYLSTEVKHGNFGKPLATAPPPNFTDTRYTTIPQLQQVAKAVMVISEFDPAIKAPTDARVIALGILDHIITKGTKLTAIAATERDDLASTIGNSLLKYRNILNRLNKHKEQAAGNFSDTTLNDLINYFVTGFTLSTQKEFKAAADASSLDLNTGATSTGTPATNTKTNLGITEIKEFYDDIVSKNIDFYNEFFNLVHEDRPNEQLNLKEAQDKSGADLAKYRLNVKRQRAIGLQTGGQWGGIRWGDPVFLRYLGDFSSLFGKIWITRTQWVDRSNPQVAREGLEALRYIFRKIYLSAPGQNSITIYDVPVNVLDVITNGFYSGIFTAGTGLTLGNRLNQLNRNPMGILGIDKDVWKQKDNDLASHIAEASKQWSLNDNGVFVRRDPRTGADIQTNPQDLCNFVTSSHSDCYRFFNQCLDEKVDPANPTTLSTACQSILDFDFDVNPSMQDLTNQIAALHPNYALGILRKLKFIAHVEPEDRNPVKGFRRYKVQSVASWLEELYAGANGNGCTRNSNAQCDRDKTLYEQLGKDSADKIITMSKDRSKDPFFTYLDLLVQWVNANPQVLNPEENLNPSFTKHGPWPKINHTFNTYQYRNPYKNINLQLRSTRCGLDRLKSSILNELAGSSPTTMVNSINTSTLGINIPLGRQQFTYPHPFTMVNSMPMFGGHFGTTELELQNLNRDYGADMMYEIYKDLQKTMEQMREKRQGKGVKIAGDTDRKISAHLATFKKLEKELREEFAREIQKNKLYYASRGYIDVDRLSDEELKKVIDKHSNLLGLSAAYNRKAINLIDIFKTIADAMLDKIGTGDDKNPMSYRDGYRI